MLKYGVINLAFRGYLVATYGEETWEKIRQLAGVEDSYFMNTPYDDAIMEKMAMAASRILGLDDSTVFQQYGEYFIDFCMEAGYDAILRALGGNLLDMLDNLDYMHYGYLTITYTEMNAPSFQVERLKDGEILLHYYTDRKGYADMVIGQVRGCARKFFNTEIDMKIVTHRYEEERSSKREHIVLSIKETTCKRIKGPGRKMKRTYTNETSGTENAQLLALNRWSAIREAVVEGHATDTFDAVYPEQLLMDSKTFCEILPFHVVFDEELHIKQVGRILQKYLPAVRFLGARMDSFFHILHPEIQFYIEHIRASINSQFIIETKREKMPSSWGGRPTLTLKGQMIWLPQYDCMMFMCSPKVTSLGELEEMNMHLSDIALHDVLRDFVLLNQQRKVEADMSKQLEMKKEELRGMSEALKAMQKKTEKLLETMLPRPVAEQLRDGKKVEAASYDEVTILFSDVVTFTNICSECKPTQVVTMLNDMYLRFDRLTTVHDVYKVETIGDAYMVTGGLPIPIRTHAERVVNMGLAMHLAAANVKSPATGKILQIRVGIHSGPTVAGVVGEKMPRYCLFGDTVNTASRMESHGIPGKVHISMKTYKLIKGRGFVCASRGPTEIKGKGLMNTYFVESSSATDHQLLGLPTDSTTDVAQVEEGHLLRMHYADDNDYSSNQNFTSSVISNGDKLGHQQTPLHGRIRRSIQSKLCTVL
ncbi:PREDICTED: guanylate cyclase soluble subunit beta-2-like [Branchiostoma belcheri]|uniref:guanylate cyclase n=1 Tax=Branchiostoma belcheri TaxID=7741 RepID=A0A6P4ZD79_BRABE|nr:PREDICTED: guanylate cyclase soluble subunit beta-2-like [Branchiostoma belcheri]